MTDKELEKIMEIVDMHSKWFPHLTEQGYKIRNRLENRNRYGYLLNEGAFITYEFAQVSSRIIKKHFLTKKENDIVLHQIGSNGKVKGSAKELLDKLIGIAKENNSYRIWLTVRKDNVVAREWYDKNGFKLMYEDDEVWNHSKEGKIGGCIYKLELENNTLNKFI